MFVWSAWLSFRMKLYNKRIFGVIAQGSKMSTCFAFASTTMECAAAKVSLISWTSSSKSSRWSFLHMLVMATVLSWMFMMALALPLTLVDQSKVVKNCNIVRTFALSFTMFLSTADVGEIIGAARRRASGLVLEKAGDMALLAAAPPSSRAKAVGDGEGAEKPAGLGPWGERGIRQLFDADETDEARGALVLTPAMRWVRAAVSAARPWTMRTTDRSSTWHAVKLESSLGIDAGVLQFSVTAAARE